jgi:hypothetical protein
LETAQEHCIKNFLEYGQLKNGKEDKRLSWILGTQDAGCDGAGTGPGLCSLAGFEINGTGSLDSIAR